MNTCWRLVFSISVLLLDAAIPDGAAAIDMCRGGDRAARKVTCVVDGDTVWVDGVKMRLLDIDAPEMHGQCQAETQRANEAADRLMTLMDSGFAIEDSGQKDRTSDRRALVRVRLGNGQDAGAMLMREGLAQPWPNKGNVWCE
ncbi:thermonuclease family protein [Rhizobium sp. YIM 134829]|uniref:thermonuclease family protein n=1 Tax=Rhizobium sp. YIM 134829 TaxID=3390453 RepID=UPI00397B67EF